MMTSILSALGLPLDGVVLLSLEPRGGGTLEVGRLAFGSLSYADMGASLWDWVELRVDAVGADGSSIAVETVSVGDVKARFH